METKMIKVFFDVELAKKITNGEIKGKIVTRNGKDARIICWDKKSDSIYNIVALLDESTMERILSYTINGSEVAEEERDNDLMLEIPEFMTFKDGDVIAFGHTEKSIAIGIFHSQKSYKSHECYVKLDWSGGLVYDVDQLTYNNARYATEEEKQRLAKALKESKDIEAKECLKKLGVQQKQEYEFKPFDKVLARDSKSNKWKIDIFREFIEDGGNEGYRYNCFYDNWNYCIPYNESTAHLLGTTEDFKL